jgi:hypothetical protein
MRAALLMLALTAPLLPACGVPPAAIKIYEDPSSPAEEGDLRPMTPSQFPGIEPVKPSSCVLSTCGNHYWKVEFVLPMPAKTSGWIVQEITYNVNVTDGEQKQRHFWEGFYVKAGATTCVYAGPDDTYSDPPELLPSNSTGTSETIGQAKFYEGTLPADFFRPDPANPHTDSGERRSTTTQPPFWDDTGTDHNLTVTWDCTAGNDIATMLSTPDPENVCPKNL